MFQDPKTLHQSGLPANLVNLMSSSALHGGKLGQSSAKAVAAAKAEPQETPAQRQAAAKQALRKQLEKTLLQVW